MVLGGCQNLISVLAVQRSFRFFCRLAFPKIVFHCGYFSAGFRSVSFQNLRFFLQQVAWLFFGRNSFNFQQVFWLVLHFWLMLAFSICLSRAIARFFWQSLCLVQRRVIF